MTAILWLFNGAKRIRHTSLLFLNFQGVEHMAKRMKKQSEMD